MKIEELKPFLGKNVKINLEDGFHYTGTIISINGDSFSFKDKFGSRYVFDAAFVRGIGEVKGGSKDAS